MTQVRELCNPRDINERALEYYPQLRKVKEYIDKNFMVPISLPEVAAVAAMEAKYFSAFFRKKVGLCFRVWLAWVRIARAMERFRSANLSITEVAFSAGFDDVTTFERNFKRFTGLTPMQFKKRVRPS